MTLGHTGHAPDRAGRGRCRTPHVAIVGARGRNLRGLRASASRPIFDAGSQQLGVDRPYGAAMGNLRRAASETCLSPRVCDGLSSPRRLHR